MKDVHKARCGGQCRRWGPSPLGARAHASLGDRCARQKDAPKLCRPELPLGFYALVTVGRWLRDGSPEMWLPFLPSNHGLGLSDNWPILKLLSWADLELVISVAKTPVPGEWQGYLKLSDRNRGQRAEAFLVTPPLLWAHVTSRIMTPVGRMVIKGSVSPTACGKELFSNYCQKHVW